MLKQNKTNKEISSIFKNMANEFSNTNISIPVKANFYIQKNFRMFSNLYNEIEDARIAIGKKHGEFDEQTNVYKIREDEIQIAQSEINELYDIEQEVEIYKVKLDDLGDINLTMAQMEALMFMVDE